MIFSLVSKLFKRKKPSRARMVHEALIGQDQRQVPDDTEPVKINFTIEVPKFTKQLAVENNYKNIQEFLEYIVIETLYVNKSLSEKRQDRYMRDVPGRGSKMVN